ncbi:SPOSA6832_04353, partial [Sporobolomyces salmonicolor]
MHPALSDSSGATLAESPTSERAEDRPPSSPKETPPSDLYDDLDAEEEAERAFADFGGNAPSSPAGPATTKPHVAPQFRTPSRQASRSSTGGGRPRANTGASRWSENGFPELHCVDSAFDDAHRALSRVSRSSAERQLGQKPDLQPQEQQPDLNKVTWEENDPENPQNWTHAKRWRITAICCFLTLAVTFASSAPSSSSTQLAEQFGVGTEVTALTTSLFLLGCPTFLISMGAFGFFQFGCGFGQNVWTVIICRFFAGTFASSPLTNCGGVVADIWGPIERGPAMSVFSASVFLGPVVRLPLSPTFARPLKTLKILLWQLGPIIGGFTTINESLRWRYVYLWIGIWAALAWLVVSCLPETYHPKLLAQRAKRMRKEDPEKNGEKYGELEKADFSLKSILVRTVARPAQMLILEPILTATTIYLAVVYGLLYGLFSAFPIIWQELRGFNAGEGGIGTTIGAVTNIIVQRHYRELVPLWHGHPPPEERLYGAMIAGPFLVIGMFYLGWTVSSSLTNPLSQGNYPSIHWAVPAVATIFIGASFSLVFISFLSYLVEVYLMYSASALAANTIVRSGVAVAFPLFVRQQFAAMGVNWACSLYAFVGLAISPSPFLFYKYGAKIRERSRFAPALDLKIRDQVLQEQREKKERDNAV